MSNYDPLDEDYEIPKQRNRGFWERVTATETGCWEWQGYRTQLGYGHIRVNGKFYIAHRYAFELTYGYMPKVVLHECDNPPCCNPSHLRAGTIADNNADMRAKGRAKWPQFEGEKHGMAKLTASAVQQIRTLYAAGDITQSQLAEQFGVSQSGISIIVLRKGWKST